MNTLDRAQDETYEASARTFLVIACSCPQTMMRVLGLFAQQALVPVSVEMHRYGDLSSLRILQDQLDERFAGIILEKIRSIPTVQSAVLGE